MKNRAKVLLNKINFYSLWLSEMPLGERFSWQGAWVKERINYFTEALKDAG
jgi:hypothetical protein